MFEIVVLCKNESSNLKKCLPNLQFADSILVLDDYSTDDSVDIAKSFGARIIKHHLGGNFAAAHNYALKHTKADWVLFIDADEIVSPKLQLEIKKVVTNQLPGGYYLRRLDIFKNHLLKYGDTGNFKVLRLQNKPFTEWTGQVHEEWTPKEKSSTLTNYLYHYPHSSIYSFLHKLNNYSNIRAEELYSQRATSSLGEIIVYPIIKFLYLYIYKLGILDGVVGFIHAMMMSFYSFLVRGKLYLLWRNESQHI